MDNRQTETLNNQNQNQNENNNIDLVSFDRRKRAEEIRQNEETERLKRRQAQLRRRKQERIKQAKIARIKGLILLAVTAIGVLCIIIGVVAAIVKIATSVGKDNTENVPDNAVSAYETELMNSFAAYPSKIYTGKSNSFLTIADKMLTDITLDGSTASIPAVSRSISDYGALSERYMYMRDSANYTAFREAVKNTPIFSNGYVWSETDSMKSSVTGGYLYDTNTSYILAVANICLAEGNISFLSEKDTDSQPSRDVSGGLTVSQKLDMAIKYLFDDNTLDGGIKYDAINTSLCYIYTSANNGSSTGTPSNKWTNFKFGNLDAYCNISFNRAMRALAKLYTLQSLGDEANMYTAVADQNAAAFSEKFWDSEKQRFVGCFDRNGNAYDYGFVDVNIEAIAAGMASDEQTASILSWLDGTREIASDTSKGADIYALRYAPRNTTVAADDKLWDTNGGTVLLSDTGAYGTYYQNGGASLWCAYYDICARHSSGNKSACATRLEALANEFNASGFKTDVSSKLVDIAGNPLSGLAPVAVLKTVFGIDIDGLYLTVKPDLSVIPGSKVTLKNLNGLGIRGINFHGAVYNFLYEENKVYVSCDTNKAVRLNLGGLDAGKEYSLVKIKNNIETVDKNKLVADKNGVVSVITDFGSDSYIRIEKADE